MEYIKSFLLRIVWISAGVLSLVIFPHLSLFSQSLVKDRHLSQYVFDVWSIDNGLPVNALYSLHRDKYGYLWISSFDGLSRFDGITFENFDMKNVSILETNAFSKMDESADSTLWITTFGSGLLKYKNGDFSQVDPENLKVKYLESILIDSKNQVWVGTRGNGMYKMEDNKLVPFAHHLPALQTGSISSILEDKKGGIWIASRTNGLVHVFEDKFKHYDFPTKYDILCLYEDSKGRFLVGTAKGVFQLEGETLVPLDLYEPNMCLSIHEDSKGYVWTATNQGLYRVHPTLGNFEHLSETNGLPFSRLSDFIFDTEGNVWVASYGGGLFRFKEGVITTWSTMEGLTTRSVKTIEEWVDGKVLVGGENVAVLLPDGKTEQLSLPNFPESNIYDILYDSKKRIWIGSTAGIYVKNPDGSYKIYNKDNKLPSDKTRVITEDSKGTIWIGSEISGVLKYQENSDSFIQISKENGLSSNFVMDIFHDPKGNTWVSTNTSGVNCIDSQGLITIYNTKNGLPSDLVFSTNVDKNGGLWFSTNAGICRLYKDQFYTYNSKVGFPTDAPFDAFVDDNGKMWFTCNMGIFSISVDDFDKFRDGKIKELPSKILGRQEGMKSRECTGAAQMLYGKNKLLYIPTLNGVSVIDPNNISVSKTPPPVLFTNLQVDNTTYQPSHFPSNFAANSNRFVFGFTSLMLSDPKNLVFEYKMEGVDTDWVRDLGSRQATYTNIPYGKRTFWVRVGTKDGLWNETPTNISFYIEPSIYQRRDVQFISSVIFILLLLGFYKWRTNAIKKQKEELERIVDLRTAEINLQKEEIRSQQELLMMSFEKIKTVSFLGQEITATLQIADLNRVVYDQIKSLMPVDGFGIGVYSKVNKRLDFNGYVEKGKVLPPHSEMLDDPESMSVRALQDKCEYYLSDVAIDYASITGKEIRIKHGETPQSAIFIPLRVEEQLLGILTVQSLQKNAYDEQHINLLRSLASYIAIAISNSRSYDIISNKNKQITDSVRYAQRIQQAILPHDEVFKQLFSEHFISFKPRDYVSGDFYFLSHIGDFTFLAVADCTGHGVPGAFMGMIGISILSKLINEERLTDLEEIMHRLDVDLCDALSVRDQVNMDGMEICLSKIYKTPNGSIDLSIVSTKMLIYVCTEEGVQNIKGNKITIGASKTEEWSVDTHHFQLKSKDALVIASDGYPDQLSLQKKRLGSPKLLSIIETFINEPLYILEDNLLAQLVEHMGEHPQVDDISVIGVRF